MYYVLIFLSTTKPLSYNTNKVVIIYPKRTLTTHNKEGSSRNGSFFAEYLDICHLSLWSFNIITIYNYS